MAINASTIWEIRTTGSQQNGGGFADLNPGTSIDYSQQDSPELTLTSISTDGTSVLTDTGAGGFTAAMVGNIIRLASSADAHLGWYQITSFVTAWIVNVDRTVAGGSGRKGYVGGAFALGGTLDSDFFAVVQKVAGNKIWIKSGTYSLGEIITIAVDGSSTDPIVMEGYNSVRGDTPTGDDRPVIDCGTAYYVSKGSASFWKMFHLIFTGSAGDVFLQPAGGGNNVYYNCKFTNTSSTANRDAVDISDGYNNYMLCEFSSLNGKAVTSGAAINKFMSCYIHDSLTGYTAGYSVHMIGCCISNCTTGLSLGVTHYHTIFGNIIYNCTTGISGTTSLLNTFVNNIISGCGTGASWTTEQLINFWDYNCWSNTIDVSNVTKGEHDITADPKLKDPDNGDFTLDKGSPCFNTGLQLGEIVGL